MTELDRDIRLDQLEAMINHKYTYGGDVVTIESIEPDGDVIRIKTDVWDDAFDLTDFDNWYPKFQKAFIKKNGVIRPENISALVLKDAPMFDMLTSKAFDLITQVEKDPAFVSQAQAANELLKTVIKAEEVKFNAIVNVLK